eukprot:c5973_g1_i1 orf=29-307(-)
MASKRRSSKTTFSYLHNPSWMGGPCAITASQSPSSLTTPPLMYLPPKKSSTTSCRMLVNSFQLLIELKGYILLLDPLLLSWKTHIKCSLQNA